VPTQGRSIAGGPRGRADSRSVTSIAVELNQEVKKGDKLLVIEAMKMQTTIYAPISGRVAARSVHVGQTVEPKDLLIAIEEPK